MAPIKAPAATAGTGSRVGADAQDGKSNGGGLESETDVLSSSTASSSAQNGAARLASADATGPRRWRRCPTRRVHRIGQRCHRGRSDGRRQLVRGLGA